MAEGNDRYTGAQVFEGYEVYDRDGDKIGKVEDLFVDERDEPEYLGVKMGLFGLSGTTLVPWELCREDKSQERIEVEAESDRVKDAPTFDDDEGITPEYERKVHDHYGLAGEDLESRSSYGAYYSDGDDLDEDGEREGSGETGPGIAMGDTDSGEFREHPPEQEGVNQPGSDLEDEDELRVQRSEEELVAGTRERETGSVNVRKRVRTEREQLRVPKKREEVKVDRVPVEEGRASEEEIGDDEVSMPVTEEEVVVSKRPEVKEEVRIRKEVEEDEEVVEEDVRKEEIEVDDDTEHRNT